MDQLRQEIKTMLVRDLKLQGVDPESIEDTAPLFGEGLGLDSLDAVELVVIIQKNFDVQIADMEEGQEAFTSVESLARFIEQRRASGEK